MTKKGFLSASEILCGDIIATGYHHKLGLVFSVLKSIDGKSVTSFKILPIYVHKKPYAGKNDADNFMLPTPIKRELRIDLTEDYRLNFTLEDFTTDDEGQVFLYAKANASTFAGTAIRRMDEKIRSEERMSARAAADCQARVFKLRDDTPTHIKDLVKPGDVLVPNISLVDAYHHEIISATLYQALSRGTYGRGKKITTLREAFELANSAKESSIKRISSVLETGLLASDVSLQQAFEDGALNESDAFETLNNMGAESLSQALKICNSKTIEDKIDPSDAHHIQTQPLIGLSLELKSSWALFKRAAFNDQKTLEAAGVRYMYPA